MQNYLASISHRPQSAIPLELRNLAVSVMPIQVQPSKVQKMFHTKSRTPCTRKKAHRTPPSFYQDVKLSRNTRECFLTQGHSTAVEGHTIPPEPPATFDVYNE